MRILYATHLKLDATQNLLSLQCFPESWYQSQTDSQLTQTELCLKHFSHASSSNRIVLIILVLSALFISVAMSVFVSIKRRFDEQDIQRQIRVRNEEQRRRIQESLLRSIQVREVTDLGFDLENHGGGDLETELLVTTLLAVSLNEDDDSGGRTRSTIVRCVRASIIL